MTGEYQISDEETQVTNDIDDELDRVLYNRPEALQKVKDNRRFIRKIEQKQIDPKHENVKVFGVKNVNLNNILKDNIWNRSIFTTDKLCRMHRKMTYEQLKKYQSKKRHVPLNMMWIIIIMFGVVAAIIVIMLLLPKLGL